MTDKTGLVLEKPIQELITLFDKKLNELNQSGLLSSDVFEMDKSLQFNNYLRFNYIAYLQGRIDLFFDVSNEGVTFYVDITCEIPEWDYDTIIKDIKSFRETIEDIFTCYILVEHKGRKTTIRLFNKSGNQRRVFRYSKGIGLNFLAKTERRLYRPVF